MFVIIFLTHCRVHHLLIFFHLIILFSQQPFLECWRLDPFAPGRRGGGVPKALDAHLRLIPSMTGPFDALPSNHTTAAPTFLLPPPGSLHVFFVTCIAIPRFAAHTVFESCNPRFATSSFGFSKIRQTCQLNTKLIPISSRQEARGLPPEGCICRLLLPCFFNQSTFQATRRGSTIDLL